MFTMQRTTTYTLTHTQSRLVGVRRYDGASMSRVRLINCHLLESRQKQISAIYALFIRTLRMNGAPTNCHQLIEIAKNFMFILCDHFNKIYTTFHLTFFFSIKRVFCVNVIFVCLFHPIFFVLFLFSWVLLLLLFRSMRIAALMPF